LQILWISKSRRYSSHPKATLTGLQTFSPGSRLYDRFVDLLHVDREDVTVKDDEAGLETLGDLAEETFIRRTVALEP
jgi:hypothetical protein